MLLVNKLKMISSSFDNKMHALKLEVDLVIGSASSQFTTSSFVKVLSVMKSIMRGPARNSRNQCKA
eukprot:4628423-Amphidinium_carterae.1